MKKALIIYNSLSKRSYFTNNISTLGYDLVKAGYIVELYATQSSKDIINKISKIKIVDLLVCAGGDGTINEVVTGLTIYNIKTKVLYFPIGTVNDLAYSLGLKNKYSNIMNLFYEDKTILMDTGKINNKFFNYVAAIGQFTDSSYLTKQTYKNLLGQNAYILNGIKKIKTDFESFFIDINCDGELISGEFRYCFLVNSKSLGGIRNFLPENTINDGVFHLILFKKNPGLASLEVPGIFFHGIKENISEDLAIVRQFKKCKITLTDEITWTIDGEQGPSGSIEVEVLEKNIEIFADIV